MNLSAKEAWGGKKKEERTIKTHCPRYWHHLNSYINLWQTRRARHDKKGRRRLTVCKGEIDRERARWRIITWNSSAIFGPSRNRRVLRQSTGPKLDVKSLNSWKTFGYMAADITSSGVMSLPCAARRSASSLLKSMGGSDAPGRPSSRGSDLSTYDTHWMRVIFRWWNYLFLVSA